MRELTQHDEEDDEAWDPGVALVRVHYLVPEQRDEEGRDGDDDHASPAGHVPVDGVEELGADDHVHRGPADTGKDVEHGDFRGSVLV